jgi:hypothetical protein
MAPVAGSSAYIVPAFVPTYSASPSTGDTDEVPSSGVLQSGHLRVPAEGGQAAAPLTAKARMPLPFVSGPQMRTF